MSNDSLFLTPEQAASILGVRVENLSVYEEAGYLRVITHDGQDFYNRPDVVRLMEVRDSGRLPTLSQESLIHMHAQISTLREELNIVLNMLGIGVSPITMEPAQLVLLYEQVVDMLAREEYSRKDLEAWATIFLRLRVGHVAALTTCTQNDRPWEVLYRLINKMCLYLSDDDAVETNVHLRSLLMRVDAARTHIINLWVVSIELDPARDYRTRLARQVPDLEDIVHQAARNKGMSVIPPVLENVLSMAGLQPPKYPKK